jgi:hypothetical protein
MQEAGQPEDVTQAVLEANASARIAGLKTALGVLAVVAIVALFFTRRIPNVQAGDEGASASKQVAPAVST